MSGRIVFTKDNVETVVDITGKHYSVMELLNDFWQHRFNQKVVVQWGVVSLTDCRKYFAFDKALAQEIHSEAIGARKTAIEHEYGSGYVFYVSEVESTKMRINPWYRCPCGKLHVLTVAWRSKCTCGRELNVTDLFKKEN